MPNNSRITRQALVALMIGYLSACAEMPTVVAPAASPPSPRFLIVPSGFTQISDYYLDACAVRTDGKLACWGLGYNFRNFPPAGTFKRVSAGSSVSCAIRPDDSLACWGSPISGWNNAPTGAFSEVSVGSNPCAIKTDGTLACWGDGHADPPPGTFTQLSSGGGQSCAVRTDQTVACWGSDISSDGFGGTIAGKATPPEGTFIQVAAGTSFTCGVRTDGTISCWGSPIYAHGPWEAPIPPPTGVFTQIAAGVMGACALRVGGSIACWRRDVGQQPPPSTGVYTQIVVGDEESFRSCARRNDGVVVCWGAWAAVPTPTDHVAPSATFTATPRSVAAGDAFVLEMTGAKVLNYPDATSFTYAFDCGDGSGFSIASPDATKSCPTSTSGYRIVRGRVIDQDGDATLISGGQVTVVGNTPTGSDVGVTPVDVTTGTTSPIQLTFENVSGSGSTTVTSSTIGAGGSPPPPSGFQLGDPPTFYDITSSSTFTGSVTLCINYTGLSFTDESSLKLLHYVEGAWVDITSPGYPNTTTKQLCGETTSFSPFAIAQSSLPQAINFSAPSSPAVIGTGASLIATGGNSGNPVTFSSLTPGICSVAGSSVTYLAIGTCTVAADQAAQGIYLVAPQATRSVTVIWPFTGFTPPVSSAPTVNAAKAGSAIPLKFALGGNRGLAIVASGSPSYVPISCSSGAPTGVATHATGALTYDAKSDIYNYTWKSDKATPLGCGRFTMILIDGTSHTALFSFK